MSKYTKGEWTIEPTGIDGGDDKLIIGHLNPNDFNVIRTIGRLFQNRPYKEMKANAQLIKTASKLLDACKVFIDEVFTEDVLNILEVTKGDKFSVWLCGIIQKAKATIAEAEKAD